MKTLEIHVEENVHVVDSIPQVVRVIEKIIQDFIESEQEVVVIEIRKQPTRGPPDLGINVSDGVGVTDVFGGKP